MQPQSSRGRDSRSSQIRNQLGFWGEGRTSPRNRRAAPRPLLFKGAQSNVFFCVQPDDSAASRCIEVGTQLKEQLDLRGTLFESWRFHVSQLGFGLVESVDDAMALASRVASLISLSSFDVTFDHVMSFSGRSKVKHAHAIVLVGERARKMEDLLQAQHEALNTIGYRPGKQRLTPHITLLYGDKHVPKQAIEPITWRVNELVLIQSHVRQGRPYTVLGRWPLRD